MQWLYHLSVARSTFPGPLPPPRSEPFWIRWNRSGPVWTALHWAFNSSDQVSTSFNWTGLDPSELDLTGLVATQPPFLCPLLFPNPHLFPSPRSSSPVFPALSSLFPSRHSFSPESWPSEQGKSIFCPEWPRPFSLGTYPGPICPPRVVKNNLQVQGEKIPKFHKTPKSAVGEQW